MQQLPLEVQLADHAVFGTFVAAGNELVIHELKMAAERADLPMVWVWGGHESGRSHLLQACIAAADEWGRRASYVPLDRALALPAEALDGLGEFALVGLDDIDAVAGDPAFEPAVFRLFELLRQSGGRLVVTASAPPAEIAFRLPDLASRMKSGGVYRLHPLAESKRLEALQVRARFRGFELPEDTGNYLLNRTRRGPAHLFRMLDMLDRAALVAQKRLTIPFVRSVIDD